MYRLVTTWLAALACFATAAIVPAVYVFGIDQVTIGALTINFVKLAPVGFFAYVLFNILSGFSGQEDNGFLYWLDYLASWLAWFSINFTAVFVGIGLVQSYADVTDVLKLPWAIWILGGLMIFSWIDVGFLQGNKHGMARATITANRMVGPAPPPVVVPPALPPNPPVGSGAVAIVMLVLGFLFAIALLASFYMFKDAPTTRTRLAAVETCSDTPVFLGIENGVRRYLAEDCGLK